MEGNSLQSDADPSWWCADARLKAKKVKGTKEKKKVKGWSTEEMKDKANSLRKNGGRNSGKAQDREQQKRCLQLQIRKWWLARIFALFREHNL